MKQSVKIAVSGLSAALSVVLLFVGGVTYILAYTMPMAAGILLVALKHTFSKSSAWITYIATSILSFFLIPDRECSLMYIFIFGIYPIVQDEINRIKNKALNLLAKLLFFNLLFAGVQLLLVYVFGIPFLEEGDGRAFLIIIPVMMNFIFLMYDRLLDRLLIVYAAKIEKRIKQIFK